ncbi:uncharacterized protein BDW70DRAFT_164661 [Aspergillus foveolatus]|uniref:uncharacterized protein n=1 Tax=Aspergillus foveolatus TaxID=210207 RepID=UPI003CCCBF7B
MARSLCLLDPLGLSVAGSRAAQDGVGGLTLGGAISYHSPRYGWTSDMVSDFEVAIANRTIARATDKKNSELTIALRDGSGVFGITRSTTEAINGEDGYEE